MVSEYGRKRVLVGRVGWSYSVLWKRILPRLMEFTVSNCFNSPMEERQRKRVDNLREQRLLVTYEVSGLRRL